MSAPSKGGPTRSTEAGLRRVKPFLKAMSRANTWLFRATKGRLGSRFPGGAPVGLLTTTGRRSGEPRTAPLIYLADGERIVVVASQGGYPRHPVWYQNLVERPEVEFETPERRRRYRARTASAAERGAYWPRLCAIYRAYDDYQKKTDREIPVVVLEPA